MTTALCLVVFTIGAIFAFAVHAENTPPTCDGSRPSQRPDVNLSTMSAYGGAFNVGLHGTLRRHCRPAMGPVAPVRRVHDRGKFGLTSPATSGKHQ
jgi:hypothetical protein